MLYLPIPLLIHLHDHNIKMPQFDSRMEDWYRSFDWNARPEMLVADFFGKYLRTPVPDDAGIVKFFDAIKRMAPDSFDLPVYLMPSEFVHDIKYDKIHDDLISTPVEWSAVFKPQKMRVGQLDLLTRLVASRSRLKILVAPTGIGKTWVFLAYARASGRKTIIIEPDKGMEVQLRDKYDVPDIMGMQHYLCRAEGKPANESACRVLGKKSPCSAGCAWYDKQAGIRESFRRHTPVATNPGNFWKWIGYAELIIVDEYHKVFSLIASEHEVHADVTDQTGFEWLSGEIAALDENIQNLHGRMREMADSDMPIPPKMWAEYDAMQYEKTWKERFSANYEHVYIYSQNDKRYMKLDKVGVVNYFAALYPDREIVFVSATPLKIKGADIIETDKGVTTKVNAPILYYPVANLSSNSISTNPEYLDLAGSVIVDMYHHFRDSHITEKVIVHSGNTGRHGETVSSCLRDHGLKVMQHRKGTLMETVDAFKKGDYDALVVASADAGYDFYGDVFGLQFILKVPYPALGEEWVAVENKHGRSYRWDMYAGDTITQIVQASGRICRGSDDTGVTVILDGKFASLYNQYLSKFPDSFKERLYDISGKLRNIAPSWQLEHYAEGGSK